MAIRTRHLPAAETGHDSRKVPPKPAGSRARRLDDEDGRCRVEEPIDRKPRILRCAPGRGAEPTRYEARSALDFSEIRNPADSLPAASRTAPCTGRRAPIVSIWSKTFAVSVSHPLQLSC